MDLKNRGAGGTPGGIGNFIFGAVLALIGLYLLAQQVTVTTSFWGGRSFLGYGVSPFGLTMIVMMIGIVLMFIDGRSRLGWGIVLACLLFTVVGIIANLRIYFAPTSLYVTIGILALLAVGIGLIVQGLRPFR